MGGVALESRERASEAACLQENGVGMECVCCDRMLDYCIVCDETSTSLLVACLDYLGATILAVVAALLDCASFCALNCSFALSYEQKGRTGVYCNRQSISASNCSERLRSLQEQLA
mmetsp:Transcript_45390/g.89414  ORF Transcript_45390/g.89414 Transcript_45390/m.89414 type:complete len:116 (+) Transcript_45390:3082-3429(+)